MPRDADLARAFVETTTDPPNADVAVCADESMAEWSPPA
jgi:hypothetical protein